MLVVILDILSDNLSIVNELLKKKHYKKALRLLLNLKEKLPSEKKIDVALAVLYREKHQYDLAIKHIAICVDSEIPKDYVNKFLSEIFTKIYDTYHDQKEIKYYLKLLDDLIKKNSNILDLIFIRSTFFCRLNRFKKAICDLKFCLKNQKNESKLTLIKWNLSLIYLKIGYIKKGCELYESRFNVSFLESNYSDYNNIYWESNSKLDDKKIFVYFEQGYGDTIQYVRFLHDLILKKAKVFFLCQKSLSSLIKNSFPEVTIVDSFSNEYDYIVPLLSLPKLLDYDNFSKLSSAKYLDVESNIKLNFEIDNNKINIGLCWRGNPKHRNDLNRSFDINCFQDILDDERFLFHSLMNFHSDDELFFMQNNQNFKNHSEHLREFNDTALLINSLDGVISVDTSLVHLSGALEVNTKLILPKIDSDFRWHLRSSKSDWYKSVKIYRQTSHSSLQDLLNKALLDFI